MTGVNCRNRNANQLDANGRPKKPSWEYRFYGAKVNGKAKQISKAGFKTEREALLAGMKAQDEYLRAGSVFEENTMSYADCLKSWMKEYVAVNCIEGTQESYGKRILLHIIPALGHYRLQAIKTESIQRFINSMFEKKYSRNILSNLLGIISNSMSYARRQGWIKDNPANDIVLPARRQSRELRHKERKAVSRDMMKKVFERFPENHSCHIPMMLAYHCGLRLGEVFGLAWEDVDLDNGILYVTQQAQYNRKAQAWRLVPPKYDSNREIRLDNEMWALLKRAHKRQLEARLHYGHNYIQLYLDKDHTLNTEKRGKPINLVNVYEEGKFIQPWVTMYASKVVRNELGCEGFDFHTLRHTHATELSEAGVNLKEIQRRLGHKSMDVTNRRYIHSTEAMVQQSVDIMNAMYQSRQLPPTDAETISEGVM